MTEGQCLVFAAQGSKKTIFNSSTWIQWLPDEGSCIVDREAIDQER